MKILKIRLNNLNSLRGEHILDLEAEPLHSAGLFVITGLTGAGKTTLLDAVTLALYAKAARYGNVAHPGDVMTRHCGECSAEVEFSVGSKFYRAVWGLHRAGKKADGKLQDPKRYIYDAETEEPLAQKIREAEQKIEELIGLDYDRFLRSVLLAQGDFAKFLEAEPKERAELLESLTATEIYSRLSKRAFKIAKEREEELKRKEEEREKIEILEPEERGGIEKEIGKDQKNIDAFQSRIGDGAKMLGKIDNLSTARGDKANAESALVEIEKTRSESKSTLECLRLHKLTVPFESELAKLNLAKSVSEGLEENFLEAGRNLETAAAKEVVANRVLHAITKKDYEENLAATKEALKTLKEEGRKAETIKEWLARHKKDEGLNDELPALVANLTRLEDDRNSLVGEWDEWKGLAAELLPEPAASLPDTVESMKAAELKTAIESFLERAKKDLKLLKERTSDSKEEVRRSKDHLDKAKQLTSLADHRHNLDDGEPCPLCGSLEHPYSAEGVPSLEIKELEKKYDDAADKQRLAEDAEREFNSTHKNLRDRRARILESHGGVIDRRKTLEGTLQALGKEVPVAGKEADFRSYLEKREKAYRKKKEAGDDAVRKKSEAKRLSREAKVREEGLKKKVSKLLPLPDESTDKKLDPEALPELSDAEKTYSDAASASKTTLELYEKCRTDRDSGAEKLNGIIQELDVKVSESEFESIEALQLARMDSEEAEEAEKLDGGLKEREIESKTLLSTAEGKISDLLNTKVLEGKEAEEFKEEQRRLQDELESLVRNQEANKLQLTQDDANRDLEKKTQEELGKTREEIVVWRHLRELIGSADGSKFRQAAQGISLGILTRHANQHLSRLRPQYEICCDAEDPLNLQITDKFEADTQRPMKSLSGGESFLASLALALGLSDLAGRSVQIDSLFVDEGFGTLDQETLEVAVATLESLRHDHKTVGVISHVSTLKERISTQVIIEIRPGGGRRIRVLPEISS